LEVDQNQLKKHQWKKHLHSVHQAEDSEAVSGVVEEVVIEVDSVDEAVSVVVTGVDSGVGAVGSEVEVDSGAVEVDLMVVEVGVDLVDLLAGEGSKVVEVMPVMEIEEVVVGEVDLEDPQVVVTLEVEEGVVTEEVEDSSKYKSRISESY